MKKTLEQILAENADEIIRQAEAINRAIKASQKMGVVWPELEPNRADYKLVPATDCRGCAFYIDEECTENYNPEFDCTGLDGGYNVIFVKVESTETKK